MSSGGGAVYKGPYVDYLSSYAGASLSGKMNINVRQSGESKALVRVIARYVFTVPPRQNQRGMTWSFESGNQASVPVENALPGTPPTRTCRSTLAAEKAILNAVTR